MEERKAGKDMEKCMERNKNKEADEQVLYKRLTEKNDLPLEAKNTSSTERLDGNLKSR